MDARDKHLSEAKGRLITAVVKLEAENKALRDELQIFIRAYSRLRLMYDDVVHRGGKNNGTDTTRTFLH